MGGLFLGGATGFVVGSLGEILAGGLSGGFIFYTGLTAGPVIGIGTRKDMKDKKFQKKAKQHFKKNTHYTPEEEKQFT